MRVRALSVLLVVSLLLVGCKPAPPAERVSYQPKPAATPPAAQALPAAPAPPRPAAMFADFPYTAEQIRDASPTGRVCIFKVTDPNGDTFTRMEFLGADQKGVTVKSSVTTPSGEAVGEDQARATWADLVKHAAYPAGFTTITPVEVTVGAGTFQAKLYEVQEGSGDVDLRAWFADELAGPPVKLEDYQAGQIMLSMEMLEHSVPEGS